MEGLSIIRIKRERDDVGLGDFVVCGEIGGSLLSKMQAVGLGQEPSARRVFRHVASCTEGEALTLLARPELLERKRMEVKQIRKADVTERDRAGQRDRLKASRLRVLEEKRTEGGGRVLDVDLRGGGKRARNEDGDEYADPIMCNGTPLKRTNLSLVGEGVPVSSSFGEVIVDLFVEESAGQGEEIGYDPVQEIYLDRFYEDEDDELHNVALDDEDPDALEVDYADSSSSRGSSDRDEFGSGGSWARSGDEENEECDVYWDDVDRETMRHFDCSPYVQEDEDEDE
jgi:hypothetical protein